MACLFLQFPPTEHGGWFQTAPRKLLRSLQTHSQSPKGSYLKLHKIKGLINGKGRNTPRLVLLMPWQYDLPLFSSPFPTGSGKRLPPILQIHYSSSSDQDLAEPFSPDQDLAEPFSSQAELSRPRCQSRLWYSVEHWGSHWTSLSLYILFCKMEKNTISFIGSPWSLKYNAQECVRCSSYF